VDPTGQLRGGPDPWTPLASYAAACIAYHFDGSDNVVDGRRTGDVFAQNVAAEWSAPDDADSQVKSGQRRPLQEPDEVGRQLCKSCRTCFKFYCMFYFTSDRSLRYRM